MNQKKYYHLYYFTSELLKVALSIAEKLEEPIRTNALIIIATTYNRLGCRDRVWEVLYLILERLHLIEGYKEKIYILFKVERLYSDPYRALEIIDLITKYLDFLESDRYVTDIFRQIAYIYMWLGRYDKAQEILQDALESLPAIEDKKEIVNILTNFKDCLANPGLNIEILFKQALGYIRYRYNYETRLNILISWGLSFARSGFHKKALEIDCLIKEDNGVPDDWMLYPNLTEKLIYYYICETKEVGKVKNILEANINSYNFPKICITAAKCYIDIKDFDRAWQIIKILHTKTRSEDNSDKAEAFIAIAQKYFKVKKIDEALSILEFAVYITELIDYEEERNSLLSQIAKIYIENSCQHIAENTLAPEIIEEEEFLTEEPVEKSKPSFTTIQAYNLVKNNRYNEAVELVYKNIKFQEELQNYIANEYYRYKNLINHRQAKDTIEQAIILAIKINNKIINTMLIDRESFENLSRSIFLLSEIADIYFKNSSYKQSENLLKQMQATSQNIQKRIKQLKSTFSEVQELYNRHLKTNVVSLNKNIYNKYLIFKNYQQVLSILKEEESNLKKVQQLTHIAIKYTESPCPIDAETEIILKKLI